MNADKVSADRVDIRAVNHGSIWLLHGDTEAGETWLDENISEDAQTFCGAIVVEPRYVSDIINGARDSGLEVTIT